MATTSSNIDAVRDMNRLQSSTQYRVKPGPGARAFPVLLLLVLALVSCGTRTVHLPPPGSAEVAADATVHRVLFIQGFRGVPEMWDRFWVTGLRRLPPECELYIVTGLPTLMGAQREDGLADALAALEAWLDDQAIPLENLHIVAHSMGGLLARRFVTEHPGAARQVFLLGTPSGGVRMLHGLNPAGWCTPSGIHAFNAANPPDPDVKWHLIAGDRFREPTGGAFYEGVPNDGLIAARSVHRFVELCGDSVAVEFETMPLVHPTWNWDGGENLLESPLTTDWVLERILADLESR